jgi:hypothetical protein
MVTFIGDVHGKFWKYGKLIKKRKDTIQVGDMGVGFFRAGGMGDHYEYAALQNPPHHAMMEGNHRFIRGNHDNLTVCAKHSQYIADGTIENDMMFIGGAFSIDRAWRTEGLDWWADEELSYLELGDLITKFLEVKPRIMVTHECPDSITNLLMNGMKLDIPSRTRQAFDSMWVAHKPEYWIFGHWHKSFNQNIMGTQFVCLNELETFDLAL